MISKSTLINNFYQYKIYYYLTIFSIIFLTNYNKFIAEYSANNLNSCAFVILKAIAPIIIIQLYIGKQHNKLLKQIPEALDLLYINLKSGITLEQSIHLVANKTSKPINKVFNTIYQQLKLSNNINNINNQLTTNLKSIEIYFILLIIKVNNKNPTQTLNALQTTTSIIRAQINSKEKIKEKSTVYRIPGICLLLLMWATILSYSHELIAISEIKRYQNLGFYIIVAAIFYSLASCYMIFKRV